MEVLLSGDIIAALIAALPVQLAAHGRAVSVGASLPDERPTEYVTVKRGGGPLKNLVTDAPQVQFEAWASSDTSAASLADLVRGVALSLAGTTVGTIPVYRVTELAGPAYLKHPIETQHRYVWTASFETRRSAAD